MRLCVETESSGFRACRWKQPPPCGCVLKPKKTPKKAGFCRQPPPCGCVLKPLYLYFFHKYLMQPPPCGCVLKLHPLSFFTLLSGAAASVRLCVETPYQRLSNESTISSRLRAAVCWNYLTATHSHGYAGSRLRAAVCWNITLLSKHGI